MADLTAKQAAEKMGFSVAWVKRLAQQRKIPGARKWGNQWVIPEAGLGADRRRKGPGYVRSQDAL